MSDKAPALHETLRPSMGAAMGRIHRLWRSAINQAVGELGMTEARWAVLLHLAKVGEGCTQQVLADELAIEMPSLTRTLNQLQELELIERRRDPADGRSWSLGLTRRVEEILPDLRRAADATHLRIWSGMTPQQKSTLHSLLEMVSENVRRDAL